MIDDLTRGIFADIRDADQFLMRQRAGGKDRRHKKEHLLLLFCEMQHGTNGFKGELKKKTGGCSIC
ncbi:MAG: hypothetical protein HY210_00980 [Candidatus Omnitrophica bacterium]|nr:hypothetical protein [Candidatus Omnitrophota bacterium]